MTFTPHAAAPDEPATGERIRLTISVTPEVHATFRRLAAAGGHSVSRSMGDWLGDTIDAAEFMAQKMEQARAAPKIVAAELHAYALGLADETGAALAKMRERKGGAAVGAVASPPPSNTGGELGGLTLRKRDGAGKRGGGDGS